MFSLVEDSVRTLVKIGRALCCPFCVIVLALKDTCSRNKIALHALIDVQSSLLCGLLQCLCPASRACFASEHCLERVGAASENLMKPLLRYYDV